MASQAVTSLLYPTGVILVGGLTNLVARPLPLCGEKRWLRDGGFIGVLNGRSSGDTMVTTPVPPASPPARTRWPIGGKTDKTPPPTPFGRFPKHKPTKLPGPPKPYDPKTSP